MSDANPTVRFSIDDNDHARRIAAVLEALGYQTVRELELRTTTSEQRMQWVTERLAHKYKLTEREREILTRVLAGKSSRKIAVELEIQAGTVKWYMHNIFAKTNTETREKLLRLALSLTEEESTPS